MKKTQEVFGLPIISISDGVEVGKVKSILINAEKGAIDYIVVESGIQILSARVLPTVNILGIGEYALTIENETVVNDIGKIPAAIDLLQKNIQVKGEKVLTKKGRLIGEVGDFYFDESESCKITGLEYIADITNKSVRIIPRESVITLGKNLIIVTEDVEGTIVDGITQLGSVDKSSDSEKKNLVNFEGTQAEALYSDISNSITTEIVGKADDIIASEGDSFFREAGEVGTDQEVLASINESVEESKNDDVENNWFNSSEQPAQEEVIIEQELLKEDVSNKQNSIQSVPETGNTASSLFEQRQKQYLNGRKATKTIVDNVGKVVVKDGEMINESIIEIAKQNGKLIELVMNNKA